MSTEIVENNLSPRIECTKNGKTIEIDEKSESCARMKKRLEKSEHIKTVTNTCLNSYELKKSHFVCVLVWERADPLMKWFKGNFAYAHNDTSTVVAVASHHNHANKQSNKDIHELWFLFFCRLVRKEVHSFLCSATRVFSYCVFEAFVQCSVFKLHLCTCRLCVCVCGYGWLCGPFNTTLSHIHPIPRSLSIY